MYALMNLRAGLVTWQGAKHHVKVLWTTASRSQPGPHHLPCGSRTMSSLLSRSLAHNVSLDRTQTKGEKENHVAIGILSNRCQPLRHVMSFKVPPQSSGSETRGTEEKKTSSVSSINMPEPEFDWEYILNTDNKEVICTNILNRKGVGDIDKVEKLWKKLNFPEELEVEDFLQDKKADVTHLKKQLVAEAIKLPNSTHPDVPIGDESHNRLIKTVGEKREFEFQPKTVIKLAEDLDMLRTENVGHTTGPRSYYLIGGLAQLEQALVRYTVDNLESHGFLLTTVPDLVHPDIVERCGFKTTGERTQVYKLDPRKHEDTCLAGTGEMPLAGFYMGKRFDTEDLPAKVMTASRCFRAETSELEEEKGIYRVHQFTKVEMFGMTTQETGEESEQMREEFVSIQNRLFSELGLHFRVLDMASQELGPSAYRKYDMESWMPAKSFWGEISSTSNCLDFQSRRLSIKYGAGPQQYKHVHTVNGTACAVPRMIMAILENNQRKDGSIEIPEVLHPYMDGQTVLDRPANTTEAKWIRLTKQYKSKTKTS